MCLLKLKTFFRDKVQQNENVCKIMVLRGSPKDELKLVLIDMNHTVLHNFLWFHLMKVIKNRKEQTFSYYKVL